MAEPSIREVACKSALTRSRIPSLDYVVNPYAGCAHGCVYCYVPSMPWVAGRPEPWGSYVDVRINAPSVLARQLRRAGPGSVNLSTTTDPYQPAEARYRLTRACLGLLAEAGRPVSILTKSPLVTRDLDILARFPDVEVGFSIASVNQELINWFEPATPPVAARLDALSMLADSGIRTYAFLGPLLPFLSDSEEDIGRLVAEVARRGVSSLIADSMNLRGVAVQRMCRILCGRRPDLVVRYRAMSQGRTAYHRSLREVVRAQAARYRLEVVM